MSVFTTIAKCPICGGEPAQVDHGWNSAPKEFYECCDILAETEMWNKIAVAMELAESTVEFTAKVSPVLTRHRNAYDRVIEVFNGNS